MKKAFSKVLLIFILAVILGVAYFIWQAIAAKKNQGPTVKAPDIQVIVQGDNKIVRNLTDGYQVTIPKESELDATKTQIFIPVDSKSKDRCKIAQGVNLGHKSIDQIKQEIQQNLLSSFNSDEIKIDQYETLRVGSFVAIRSIILNTFGYSLSVHIPTSEKEYYFIMYFDPKDLTNCTGHMDDFIKTFSLIQ